jgi:hypothetical protein
VGGVKHPSGVSKAQSSDEEKGVHAALAKIAPSHRLREEPEILEHLEDAEDGNGASGGGFDPKR